MLKTGERCNWDDLEIGEVFAWYNHHYMCCWSICIKLINDEAQAITSDNNRLFCLDFYLRDSDITYHNNSIFYDVNKLYKLPKLTQFLFKTPFEK